jgi:imidazolonepropionase-like amidohydrolase
LTPEEDTRPILFRNAALFDPRRGELVLKRSLLVRGETVAEVGGPELVVEDARQVDLQGRTLMPGLIDCHVHVCAVTADLSALPEWSPSYVAAGAGKVMREMLGRGFTTVRDAAGADYGLADAVEEGLFEGPRLVFCGKALSQTGGHGDFRRRGRSVYDGCYCSPGLGRICDGVAEVRRAARDEIRRGASHIKLMLSGGVASPTDRVDSRQFSLEEIRAAVEEAENANLYVTGHAYTAPAINRGLECGVRCIEHGNLMDESSVQLFRERDAFYVPTLATYSALAEHGPEYGLPADSHRKVFDVLEAGLGALEMAHRGGVRMAYGTDLLGGMHQYQLNEFRLRAQVQSPAEILRSATLEGARLLRMEGRIGELVAGAYADLLVLEGDPVADIGVMADPGRHLRLVMKGGRVFRGELAAVGAARG